MTVPLNQNLKRDFYESFKKRRKSSTEDLQGLVQYLVFSSFLLLLTILSFWK